MNNAPNAIYPVGAKVFLGGSAGAFTVVEHIVAPFAKGTYDGRPCAPGETPTHYTLKNHRANTEFVTINTVLREVVAKDNARALVERLRSGEPESLDALAKLGFVVKNPPPKRARAYDVNDLNLSLEDNVRVLRAYYALGEAQIAAGPSAWLSSFERIVLGELALALDVSFESLRDELHGAHAGIAAYDAKADERAAARKAAMDNAKKRKKKPSLLP